MNRREGGENVEKVEGTKAPSGEMKGSEESTTKELRRQQDTRTSGGNDIESETERGLEDENDDRDQTTRATKMMRDPVPRTTEMMREPKRRLSNAAKT